MSRLRYAGFVEETAYNETPAAATQHVDITSASLDVPADTELVYGGGIGRAPRTRRPGYYSPSGNVVFAFDIHTIGRMLKWALASVTGEGYVFTADTPPAHNTHEFYGMPDVLPPSFCTRLGKDFLEHVFAGCAVNSLELAIDNEYCVATVDIMAAEDSKVALQELGDLILPTEYPLVFHEATVQLAGDADTEARVKSLGLTIANNLDADRGKALGDRHPVRMLMGEREVTADLNLYFENTDEMARFWGGATGPAATGATGFPLLLTFDAGTAGSLEISLPDAWYTNLGTQGTGKDEIVQSGSVRALVDTITLADAVTDVESEILCTLLNDQGDLS